MEYLISHEINQMYREGDYSYLDDISKYIDKYINTDDSGIKLVTGSSIWEMMFSIRMLKLSEKYKSELERLYLKSKEKDPEDLILEDIVDTLGYTPNH